MDSDTVVRHFERMGARCAISGHPRNGGLRADVRRRGREEWFELEVGAKAELRVVDVRPEMRHLLLLGIDSKGVKNKFLCGHDEREWFVAGVPDDRGVSGVKTALQALKPPAVRLAEERAEVRAKNRQRRRNEAFVRQGEWFFLPMPGIKVDPALVLRNEPLQRSGGKPHVVDEAFRTGGKPWYVSWRYPNGVSENRYQQLLHQRPVLRSDHWTVRRINPNVYVRGRVRHLDHATIHLPWWHLVQMNTEHKAPSMQHVAFID
ncbi:MAG: hypothetical protein AAGI53_00430 [Planctomycetota bacterium]